MRKLRKSRLISFIKAIDGETAAIIVLGLAFLIPVIMMGIWLLNPVY